jgi:hypothetical protein
MLKLFIVLFLMNAPNAPLERLPVDNDGQIITFASEEECHQYENTSADFLDGMKAVKLYIGRLNDAPGGGPKLAVRTECAKD